jgi:hypothetical protein
MLGHGPRGISMSRAQSLRQAGSLQRAASQLHQHHHLRVATVEAESLGLAALGREAVLSPRRAADGPGSPTGKQGGKGCFWITQGVTSMRWRRSQPPTSASMNYARAQA